MGKRGDRIGEKLRRLVGTDEPRTDQILTKVPTEDDLRKWLRKQLGRPVDKHTWQWLLDGRYISEVIEIGDRFSYDNLEEAARRFTSKPGRLGRKPKDKSVPDIRPLLSDDDHRRAEVFSEYLGMLARQNPAVTELRDRLLGGGVLRQRAAEALLASHAPRYCSQRFFALQGVPIAEQRSFLLDPAYAADNQPSSWTGKEVVRIEWDGGTFDVPEADRLHAAAEREGKDFRIGDRVIRVLPGSVFDEIRQASQRLADHYHWSEFDGTMFLLTDRVPVRDPISADVAGGIRANFEHYSIEFRIEPWVAPETVLRVYRAVQKHVYGKQSRPIGEKNLVLFRFVAAVRLKYGREPTWSDITRLWNRTYKSRREWQYDDFRNLRRDFVHTAKAIVYPHSSQRRRRK